DCQCSTWQTQEHRATCAFENGHWREEPKRQSTDQPSSKASSRPVSLEASQHSNTQANSEPPSDLDEQQESVLAVGGHNLASGGREVNGS
ncbi:hypothetical protein FOXB_16606, partial [Fusarium oxysporum f. sp. conglutinans Fo5176]